MVHVAHDGDHRSARQQVLGVVDHLALGDDLFFVEGGGLDLIAELGGNQAGGVELDALVDVHAHHAERPKLLDHLVALDPHLLGQIGHPDGLAHADHALVLRRRRDERLLELLAGHRDLLAGRPARPLPGRPRRAPVAATRAARNQTAPSHAAQFLIAILDLDLGNAGLAARPARQLDELPGGSRTGHHRLWNLHRHRDRRHRPGLARQQDRFSLRLRCDLGRARPRRAPGHCAGTASDVAALTAGA